MHAWVGRLGWLGSGRGGLKTRHRSSPNISEGGVLSLSLHFHTHTHTHAHTHTPSRFTPSVTAFDQRAPHKVRPRASKFKFIECGPPSSVVASCITLNVPSVCGRYIAVQRRTKDMCEALQQLKCLNGRCTPAERTGTVTKPGLLSPKQPKNKPWSWVSLTATSHVKPSTPAPFSRSVSLLSTPVKCCSKRGV